MVDPLLLRGHSLSADVPRIMGILNATPDSFHAGSRVSGASAADQALRMVSRAQEMSLEWLHTMQEIRSEPLLTDHLETWPNSSVLAGTRIPGWQP